MSTANAIQPARASILNIIDDDMRLPGSAMDKGRPKQCTHRLPHYRSYSARRTRSANLSAMYGRARRRSSR